MILFFLDHGFKKQTTSLWRSRFVTQLCLTNSSQGLLYVFTKQNSLINQVPLTISYHNTTMSFEEQNKI